MLSRRRFLQNGLGVLGSLGSLDGLARRAGLGRNRAVGYGPLAPIPDSETGLPLLRLPRGFRYTTFGWTGDLLDDGAPTPSGHDGMAVVGISGNEVVLVRNHELGGTGTALGASGITYDPKARGGTTTLVFHTKSERLSRSFVSLAGTVRNCGGGTTPWGSWLSGEENAAGTGAGFDEDHGWVFEVPGTQAAQPAPIRSMGRFLHEAVAVDPVTGFVYETEDDRYTSGLYRYRPSGPGELGGLHQGGVLEMLQVAGSPNADLQQARLGDTHDVGWVVVDDPEAGFQSGVGPFGGFDGQTTSASGPFLQGWAKGAARFRRLEGIAIDARGRIFFADTEGGPPSLTSGAPEGTIWCYRPDTEVLRVVFQSTHQAVLDNPDNLGVSPRGGVLVCEDGQLDGARLHGLTPRGELFPFAQNDVSLSGEKNGFVGSFRGSEWAGATFDPSGRWLFANLQSPGITFAITGPWESGAL